MITREALLEKHAEELKALELEQAKVACLPIPPDSFCGPTWKTPYVTYRKKDDYPRSKQLYGFERGIGPYIVTPRETYTLREAIQQVVKPFQPFLEPATICTTRCTSIQPLSIQREEYKNGTHRGEAYIQLVLSGGEGYHTTKLIFFARVNENWFRVIVEIQRQQGWSPTVKRKDSHYDRNWFERGIGPYVVTPRKIGEDQVIRYSSPDRFKPYYHLVYTWASQDNFEAWAFKD